MPSALIEQRLIPQLKAMRPSPPPSGVPVGDGVGVSVDGCKVYVGVGVSVGGCMVFVGDGVNVGGREVFVGVGLYVTLGVAVGDSGAKVGGGVRRGGRVWVEVAIGDNAGGVGDSKTAAIRG